MPRRHPRKPKSAPPTTDGVVAVVCRGGDCGSRLKHPDIDHRRQLEILRAAAVEGGGHVVASRCLDACDHSNVVVVIPASQELGNGETAVWIGQCNNNLSTEEITAWIARGGPGATPKPVSVEVQRFHPSRANRHELEEELG